VLKVEDWAEIHRLHRAEGMAIRAIARRLGICRPRVWVPSVVMMSRGRRCRERRKLIVCNTVSIDGYD
jgi:hypothetical protein